MSRAVVVVESMFGNTEAVARAVADGLADTLPTEVVPVADALPRLPDDVALVVVGGPTHAFGMSRRSTRDSAVDQGAHPGDGARAGIREWLAGLDRAHRDVLAAAFDTRVRRRGVPGSAAKGADRRLRHLRYAVVAAPETFWVGGTEGPLLAGELDRARSWGAELGTALGAADDGRDGAAV